MVKEKKVRLFTALSVPESCKEKLQSIVDRNIEGRWLHPDDLHITLRFLGDIPQDRLPEIQERISRVKRSCFHVEVGGLDIFRLKKQVIFWAGVQSTRKLTALAGDINEKLMPLGFDMPTKPFIPHVTLARLKSDQGLENLIKIHEKTVSCRWQAVSFGLFQSTESEEKSIYYKRLAEYPLNS